MCNKSLFRSKNMYAYFIFHILGFSCSFWDEKIFEVDNYIIRFWLLFGPCSFSNIAVCRDIERFNNSTNVFIFCYFDWSPPYIIRSIGIHCQRGQNLNYFCMPIACCIMNWSFSSCIWCIRIVRQRGQDFENFCIPFPCCPLNWSPSCLIMSIRIVYQWRQCFDNFCLSIPWPWLLHWSFNISSEVFLHCRTCIAWKIKYVSLLQNPFQVFHNICSFIWIHLQFNGSDPVILVLH